MGVRRAIVTGASGFLGTALVRRLSEEGATIWAVVREGFEGHGFDGLANVTVVRCDMSRYAGLAEMIGSGEPLDAFYHLAWDGTSGKARGDVSRQLCNTEYSCEAVRQAASLGVQRFVFAGSIMEHEAICALRCEEEPPRLGQIYSAAKLAAHQMCRVVASQSGVAFIRAVISNIYGPGEHSGRFLISVLGEMLKGNHISLTTCDQPYDFMYIDDAVNLLALMGDKGVAGASYYVGNPEQKPLREYVEEMRRVMGSASTLGFGERGSVGMFLDYSALDPGRAQRDFGFTAQVSFADGVARTARWMRGQRKGEDAVYAG